MMKTFKQLLSETDLRFGTPEDPRLNIHDPLYDTTSAYDPEHAKIMRAVAGSDSDIINTNARGGGRSGRLANEVVPFPDAENTPHRDTFHSFNPMTQVEVAKHLGYKDRQGASALEFAALKKLLAGLQNDEKLKALFVNSIKDKQKGES